MTQTLSSRSTVEVEHDPFGTATFTVTPLGAGCWHFSIEVGDGDLYLESIRGAVLRAGWAYRVRRAMREAREPDDFLLDALLPLAVVS